MKQNFQEHLINWNNITNKDEEKQNNTFHDTYNNVNIESFINIVNNYTQGKKCMISKDIKAKNKKYEYRSKDMEPFLFQNKSNIEKHRHKNCNKEKYKSKYTNNH